MKHFYEDILRGVDVVYNPNIPGRIIVFGNDAEPVLTGSDIEDVIIAAAKLNKGKILVFSHDMFGLELCNQERVSHNSVLYDNIKKWLLDRCISCKILELDKMESIDEIEVLQGYDIIICSAVNETTSSHLISQYVKEGGSFVHSATPWGWSMLNPGKSIFEMPYLDVINEAGITYSLELSNERRRDLLCANNKAFHAHIGKCLAEENDLNNIVEQIGLIRQLKEVPFSLFNKDLYGNFEKHWTLAYEEVTKLAKFGKIKSETGFEKKLLDFCILGMEILNKKNFKACGIEYFPGDFSSLPSLSCKELKYNSNIQDYYFTSCYVPAGTEVVLKVTKVNNTWLVLVGAHTDHLKDELVQRWPKIYFEIEISSPGRYDISSPFGGSMYFLSPKEADSFIEASVDGIVICPRFDLQDESCQWEKSKNEPGLWADISGRHVTVTLPSSSVRDLEDPTAAIEMYDRVLEAYHDLRGSDVAAERRMWIVADVQTSAGYMHAGYPIVTHLNVADPEEDGFLLRPVGTGKTLVDEKWGIFHELGHNMQLDEWTFEGTEEVTVNIFTLYGMETVFGVSAWIHPWLRERFRTAVGYLNDGADFQLWKNDPGVALYFYAQLVASFGWSAFKAVFRRYRSGVNESEEEEKVSLSNQEKIDKWFLTFSEVTERNLYPLALLWGIPLSDECKVDLLSLKFDHFIPDDELTREVEGRIDYVREQLSV